MTRTQNYPRNQRSKSTRKQRYFQKIADKRQLRAKSQILRLAELLVTTPDLELKRQYVLHLRAIAQKVQCRIPSAVRYRFCRRCSEPFTLLPYPTFTIRTRSKPKPHLVYTCLKCGYIRRKPIHD